MVTGVFNNKCKIHFSKIPPNDVCSISTLFKLGASKQIEFLNIYLAVKSRSKQPEEGRLSAVLKYACRYFQNLLSTMTLKVLWIYLLILPLILYVHACLSPWGVCWTWRLPRALGFASDFQSSGNNVNHSPGNRARRSSLLSFLGAFVSRPAGNRTVVLTGLVNQRPLVVKCLAGWFITILSVLINLVMRRLPKKETRKSCVTKGETWRRAAGRRAWQSSLAGGGGGGSQRRPLTTCRGCHCRTWLAWGRCRVSPELRRWRWRLQGGRGPPLRSRWWL